MIRKLLLLTALNLPFCVEAALTKGDGVSQERIEKLNQQISLKMPHLWQVIEQISADEITIHVEQLENEKTIAIAKGRYNIHLSKKLFSNKFNKKAEERAILVLLHQYGHIAYNRYLMLNKNKPNFDRSHKNHQYAAYKYAVIHATKMADNNYRKPIELLIKGLPYRLDKSKPSSAHHKALKKLLNEKFWQNVVAKYS